MFSPSSASFIEFITVCSLVLITSCIPNPRFLLRLHDSSVLQSMINFNAKSLRKNLLFGCFFGLSANSCLCFLNTESYLFLMTGKFSWPNFSSTCFSFNYNIPISFFELTLFSLIFSYFSLTFLAFCFILSYFCFSLIIALNSS